MLASPFPFRRPRPNRNPYRQIETLARNWAFALDPGSRWNVEHAPRLQRLFSETLAGPARPPRDRWYAAWRAVADAVAAGDRAGVVVALAGDAVAAFRDLGRVAGEWRRAADAAAPPMPTTGRVVRRPPADPPHPPPDRGPVKRWLTDLDEFRGWARSIAAAVTLPALVRMMDRELGAPPRPRPAAHDRILLQLVAAGASAAEFAADFDDRGTGWLGGFTGVLAGAVVPPPVGYRFRPDELPAGGGVAAARVLFEAITPFIDRCHTHDFVRRYLPPAASPPPAARPPVASGPARPAAAPPPPAPPPPPADPPAWIARHFRGHQRKLLLALWGKGAVPIAVLYKAVGYTDRERLRRRISAVGSGLMQKRDLIGGRWVIEKSIDGDEPAFLLRQLPGTPASPSRPDPTNHSR